MSDFIEKRIPEDEHFKVLGDDFDYGYIRYTNKLIYTSDDKISKILCKTRYKAFLGLISGIKEFMKDELEIHNELIIFLEYGDRYEGGPTILLYLNKDT